MASFIWPSHFLVPYWNGFSGSRISSSVMEVQRTLCKRGKWARKLPCWKSPLLCLAWRHSITATTGDRSPRMSLNVWRFEKRSAKECTPSFINPYLGSPFILSPIMAYTLALALANFKTGKQKGSINFVLSSCLHSSARSLKRGSSEKYCTVYWRSCWDRSKATSVTLEDNLVIFNKPITGASYERHEGGQKLDRCLFALAGIFGGCRGKMMPISTPGDVLNDRSNLILQYWETC